MGSPAFAKKTEKCGENADNAAKCDGKCGFLVMVYPPPKPPPPPPTPGARHLDLAWRHGGVSPARTGQNRGAAPLPQLCSALGISSHLPVGYPPLRDAGCLGDRVAGTGAFSTCRDFGGGWSISTWLPKATVPSTSLPSK